MAATPSLSVSVSAYPSSVSAKWAATAIFRSAEVFVSASFAYPGEMPEESADAKPTEPRQMRELRSGVASTWDFSIPYESRISRTACLTKNSTPSRTLLMSPWTTSHARP